MSYRDMPNWNRFVQETLQRLQKPPQAAERTEPTTNGGVTNGQKNTQVQSKTI